MRRAGVRGTISIFVALMMLITTAVMGISVDFTRIHMASLEVNNAADLSASSALAYYDGLLKDMYGLFAVSQDKAAYEEFCEEYVFDSLGLSEAGKKSTPSLNMFSSKNSVNPLSVSINTERKYSLKNAAYFQYEIEQYMKFRVLYTFMPFLDKFTSDGGNISDLKSLFSDNGKLAKNDEGFIKTRYNPLLKRIDKICKNYEKLYNQIGKVEKLVKKINKRINPLKIWGVTIIKGFNDATNDNLKSINKAYKQIKKNKNVDSNYKSIEVKAGRVQKDVKKRVDVIDKCLKELELAYQLSKDIENETKAVNTLIAQYQEELKNGRGTVYSAAIVGPVKGEKEYTNDDKVGLYKQLEGDKKILLANIGRDGELFYSRNKTKLSGIRKSYTEVKYGNKSKSSDFYDLEVVKNNAKRKEAPIIVSKINWNKIQEITFRSFPQPNYYNLGERRKQTKQQKKDIKKQEKETKKQDEEAKKLENKSKKTLKAYKNVKIPKSYNTWSGKYESIKTSDNGFDSLINRALIVEYGVQMFSNYTTNGRYINGKKQNSYEDKTLTGILLSEKVNYMYGAELEYVLFGKDVASKNLSAMIATLSSIKFVQNYIYTFNDAKIKDTLKVVAAIPYVGRIVAELGRIALTGFETWSDVSMLRDGKKVPLFKKASKWGDDVKKWEWKTPKLTDAYNKDGPSSWSSMYYYEYLRMLLLFNVFSSNEEISKRMSVLVELNINNYQQGIGGCSKNNELKRLDFKLQDAFVIVDAEVKGSMPYFFLPMPTTKSRAEGIGFDFKKYDFNVVKSRGY